MSVFVKIGARYDYDRLLGQINSNENFYFCCEAPDFRFKGIKRFFYKAHNTARLRYLPLRPLWAKSLVSPDVRKKIAGKDRICFIFSGNSFNYQPDMKAFDYLRKHYPGCKIIYSFNDRVNLYEQTNRRFDLEWLRKETDLLITYNPVDAEKYGIALSPPKVMNYDWVEDDESIPKADVFFIGRPKGRIGTIFDTFEKCRTLGLKAEFFLVGVPEEERKYADEIHYSEYLPYREMLKHVKRSKCVLNLLQPNADGVTLRDYEAIGMNKVLLTNGEAIFRSAFFTEEKLIRLDSLEREAGKIVNASGETEWNGRTEYSQEAFYRWMEACLFPGSGETASPV